MIFGSWVLFPLSIKACMNWPLVSRYTQVGYLEVGDWLCLLEIEKFSCFNLIAFHNSMILVIGSPQVLLSKQQNQWKCNVKQFVVTNCSKERPGSIVNETLKNGILMLKDTSKELDFYADFKYINFVKFSLCHQKLRAWENLPYFGK